MPAAPSSPGKSASKSSSSSSLPLYSIILPTYNESDNLPLIVYLINETLSPYASSFTFEIVVVDDNSPDGTTAIAHSLSASYASPYCSIKVQPRAGKLGLGSAYLHGLKFATGSYIILMDADLSHHPRHIPEMISAMKTTGCDVVTGSRYRGGGGVCGWDVKRKLTSVGANYLAGFALGGGGVSDLTGSFRLYKRAVVEKVFPMIVSKGYVFQMEIMVRCVDCGFKVEEVGIVFVDRIYGESKLGAGEIIGFLKGVVHLFLTA